MMGDYDGKTIPTEEAERTENREEVRTEDLELLLVLMVGPQLVAGDGKGDQVEQGGDPAVEGGLLVPGVQRSQPLLRAPLLTRLSVQKRWTLLHLTTHNTCANFACVTRRVC